MYSIPSSAVTRERRPLKHRPSEGGGGGGGGDGGSTAVRRVVSGRELDVLSPWPEVWHAGAAEVRGCILHQLTWSR